MKKRIFESGDPVAVISPGACLKVSEWAFRYSLKFFLTNRNRFMYVTRYYSILLDITLNPLLG